MLRKLPFASSLRSGGKDRGKVVKYTPYASRHSSNDDDLDEVAVISNATPENVRYGSGSITTVNGPRVVPGIITSAGAEKSRVLPSKPYSIRENSKIHGPSSGMSTTSPGASKVAPTSTEKSTTVFKSKSNLGGGTISTGIKSGTNDELKSRRSSSRTSLIETISKNTSGLNGTRSGSSPGAGSGGGVGGGSSGGPIGSKVLPGSTNARKSKPSAVSANTNQECEILRKRREMQRREMKKEMEKWETVTNIGGEKSGCNWSFVFDPSGRLCYYWSMIVSLAFLYNFWVIMYRFAFDEISSETMASWLLLDGIADFIYVLDIAVHFRTGYLEEGVLQTDGVKLRQHYMNSTMFYIDLLCLLPLDFLYLSIGFNSVLRGFRLVKIYRFWAFLDRTERHTNYPNVFRAVSLTHYILVIFHWNACFYHLISIREGFGSADWFTGSRGEDCADVVCDYLHAFYWSTLALTTIGDLPRPRTKGEYLFLIVELVSGLFLLATVLGHVANIVTNVSAARKEFQAKLDAVKTYMRMRRVPEHLKNKVIKWFDYLWMTQKSTDEDRSVGFLPAKLKAEIAIHVHLDTLKRVEIFQNTEAGFLCALVLRLRPVLFSPGDYVCRKGEVGKEMYIVNRGKLQVVTDSKVMSVLATLRAGSYFGEISILNMGTAGNRRTASVRSVGYSDLFCLSKQDMWDVLKDYPAARVRLEAIAVKRLEKYRKEPLKKISMGRSRSTPGLVESQSQIPITEGPRKKEPTSMSTATLLTEDRMTGNKSSVVPGGATGSEATPDKKNEDESESSKSSSGTRRDPSSLLCPPIYNVTPPTPLPSPYLTHAGHHPFIVSPTLPFHIQPHQHQQHHHHHHPAYERRPSNPNDILTTGTTSPVPFYPSDRYSLNAFRAISPAQSAPHLAPLPLNLQPPPPSPSVQSSEGRSLYPTSVTPTETPQELLLAEIKRLRERLVSLETENASMSIKLSQQQWQVENRLAELEIQITSAGQSSVNQANLEARLGRSRSSTPSDDDSERNKESII